jgi:outer membrane protein TolC
MGWRMKRWLGIRLKQWFAGGLAMILGLGILAGCQPTYLVKENYESSLVEKLPHFKLDPKIDENCPPTGPLTNLVKAPPTVNEPERPQRPMTLQEAIALALENGTVSGNNPGSGVADPNFPRFNGAGSLNGQTDAIRVIALNPALANASMEAAVSRFDAIMVVGSSWTNTDAIAGVPNLPGYLGSTPGQTANFQSSIIKAFTSGGVANVSFLTDYRNTNLNLLFPGTGQFTAPMNPEWSTRVSFGFEQPLWRDFGSEINSLLPRFPSITGNSLASTIAQTGYNGEQGNRTQIAGAPVEGTLISRLRQDQSRAEFERNVQILVLNTEVAYWNLYNKYGQLYSFEENLRILQKAYQESFHQYKNGKLGADKFFQFEAQFHEFRGERTRAVEELLQAERDFRRIVGLPVEDGTRITPITPPSLAEFRPNWDSCLQDTLALSPELILARENLRYHQYLMSIQKNNLKPDLRAYMRYEPFGDGTSLIGSGGTYLDSSNTTHTADSLRSLAGGHLVDYQFGVYMNVPLGFRLEYAALRSARLQLAQAYYFLRDAEDRKINYLAGQYQEVIHWYKRIEDHRDERTSYLNSLKSLDAQVKAGKILFSDAQNGLQYLVIQRGYAAALVKEFQAIAEYNNAVSRLEWAKGTGLKWNNVHISEGPLPQAAQVRAVEYEKDRSRSLVLRQRPDSLLQPGRLCATKACEVPTTLTADPGPIVPAEAPLPKVEKQLPPLAPGTGLVVPPEAPLPKVEKQLPSLAPGTGLVVPPEAPLPKVEKQLPPLPKVEPSTPAKSATSSEAKPAESIPLVVPTPRFDGPARPLSLQATPEVKQASGTTPGAIEQVVTPVMRSAPDALPPIPEVPITPAPAPVLAAPAPPIDIPMPPPRP